MNTKGFEMKDGFVSVNFICVADEHVFKYVVRLAQSGADDAIIQGFVSGKNVAHSITKIVSFFGNNGTCKNLEIFDQNNNLIDKHKGI